MHVIFKRGHPSPDFMVRLRALRHNLPVCVTWMCVLERERGCKSVCVCVCVWGGGGGGGGGLEEG